MQQPLGQVLKDNMGWLGWGKIGNLTTYEKNEQEQN